MRRVLRKSSNDYDCYHSCISRILLQGWSDVRVSRKLHIFLNIFSTNDLWRCPIVCDTWSSQGGALPSLIIIYIEYLHITNLEITDSRSKSMSQILILSLCLIRGSLRTPSVFGVDISTLSFYFYFYLSFFLFYLSFFFLLAYASKLICWFLWMICLAFLALYSIILKDAGR